MPKGVSALSDYVWLVVTKPSYDSDTIYGVYSHKAPADIHCAMLQDGGVEVRKMTVRSEPPELVRIYRTHINPMVPRTNDWIEDDEFCVVKDGLHDWMGWTGVRVGTIYKRDNQCKWEVVAHSTVGPEEARKIAMDALFAAQDLLIAAQRKAPKRGVSLTAMDAIARSLSVNEKL